MKLTKYKKTSQSCSLNEVELGVAKEIYMGAFPPEERRPWESIIELAGEGQIDLQLVKNEHKVIGLATIWKFPEFYYLEHLAINSAIRGKGIGSLVVKEIIHLYPGTILLEAEPRGASEIADRRLGFYHRLGFTAHHDFRYIQPPYSEGLPIVRLTLLTYGEDNPNLKTLKSTLYKYVYKMTHKSIYLAGGCFWGTEHFMSMVPGVVDTQVGYANSNVENPSYKLVCTGSTDAAETVKVDYIPQMVSLEKLLQLYFMTIDPTSINKQGGDCGTQYRTGIYYTDPEDLPIIKQIIDVEALEYDKPIAVEVKPLTNFFPAEEYHQDYLDKNPWGYCHISPELFEFVRNLHK